MQMTEVYEYARCLDPSGAPLQYFQSYKLIYASRLAEAGFSAEALR